VPWNGIETRHGWQGRATSKEDKPEQQAKKTKRTINQQIQI